MKCNKYKTKSGKEIRLWQGDCMELMDNKPENYWDLAIVDPPYGIDVAQNGTVGGNNLSEAKDYGSKDWDRSVPKSKYFSKLFGISSNQVLFGANHYISKIGKDSPCWIVWDKDNSGNFADCELAWTSFDTAVRMFKNTWNGMLQHNMKDKQKQIHPTEKPIRLYRWILTNYAEEGDTILDTHGGSMSLAIACYMEDYELDIIELDEDYYSNAVQRFEQHISQQTLF